MQKLLERRVQDHLKKNNFDQFNTFVINKLKSWCSTGQMNAIEPFLNDINEKLSQHTDLKNKPLELIRVPNKKILKFNDIKKIPFKHGLGYVRWGEYLYFVNQALQTYDHLNWGELTQKDFDICYQPSTTSTILSYNTIKKIHKELQDHTTDYMNLNIILFNKKYAEEMLSFCCENKIELKEDIINMISENYLHYFLFHKRKEIDWSHLLVDMEKLIDLLKVQNNLSKNKRCNIKVFSTFQTMTKIISDQKSLLITNDYIKRYEIEINIICKMRDYFSSLNNIHYQVVLMLDIVKKTLDVSKRLDEHYNFDEGYRWRLKAQELYSETLHRYTLDILHQADPDFFKNSVFFDMLFKIEVLKDLKKNPNDLFENNNDEYQLTWNHYLYIDRVLGHNTIDLFDLLARNYLVPKVFINSASDSRKLPVIFLDEMYSLENYAFKETIERNITDISKGLFHHKDCAILCGLYPDILVRYKNKENIDLNLFNQYICILSIFTITKNMHAAFIFIIDNYINNLRALNIHPDTLNQDPLLSIFITWRNGMDAYGDMSSEKKLKALQDMYERFSQCQCILMMMIVKEKILEVRIEQILSETSVNEISIEIQSLSNKITEYFLSIQKSNDYDHVLYTHLCNIQFNFYIKLLRLFQLHPTMHKNQHNRNIFIHILESQKDLFDLLKKTSETKEEITFRKQALHIMRCNLMPLYSILNTVKEPEQINPLYEKIEFNTLIIKKTKKKNKKKKQSNSNSNLKPNNSLSVNKKKNKTQSKNSSKISKHELKKPEQPSIPHTSENNQFILETVPQITDTPNQTIPEPSNSELILAKQPDLEKNLNEQSMSIEISTQSNDDLITESSSDFIKIENQSIISGDTLALREVVLEPLDHEQKTAFPSQPMSSVLTPCASIQIASVDLQKLYEWANFNKTELFVTGGCIRDILLNIAYRDIDLLLPRSCQSVLEFQSPSRSETFFPVKSIHIEKLLTLKIDNKHFDITCDPDFEWTEEGLKNFGKTRDYTINAFIARYNPNTLQWDVFDPTQGGVKHLNEKKLHKVCDWKLFLKDPKRLWRGLLLHLRHHFELPNKFKIQMKKNRTLLLETKANSSYYLRRIFSQGEIDTAFSLLKELDILLIFFPTLHEQLNKITGLEKAMHESFKQISQLHKDNPPLMLQETLLVLRGLTYHIFDPNDISKMDEQVNKAFGYETRITHYNQFFRSNPVSPPFSKKSEDSPGMSLN